MDKNITVEKLIKALQKVKDKKTFVVLGGSEDSSNFSLINEIHLDKKKLKKVVVLWPE